MTDLSEAKRLCEAATPGEWFCPDHEDNPSAIKAEQRDRAVYVGDFFEDSDRQLIAWSRNNLPTLLAEHEALRAMVADLAEDLTSELDGRYAGMLDHPAMKRRYDRDMSTVVRARAVLAEGGEG